MAWIAGELASWRSGDRSRSREMDKPRMGGHQAKLEIFGALNIKKQSASAENCSIISCAGRE
jgi:hypothetical protein